MPEYWPLLTAVAPLVYVVYLLLMAAALRRCGVASADIARWALRQAERQRFADLIRVVHRGHRPLPTLGEHPSTSSDTPVPTVVAD